jgi:outer membrane receptor protein involved in Fe transport
MSTRHIHILIAVVLGLASFGALPARAGTTGKLTGRVVDDKKQPLVGANVRIEGQRLGAVSDESGNYVIIGIPAGMHIVRVNMLGYAPYVADRVVVTADFTTTLDASLKTEAVQIGEVRVDAERPLLQRDATSTSRFIQGDEIARQPIRGYREAAAQQSGIVAFQRQIDVESNNGPTLIVRGGRPNETAYFVDGFSQQDPLTGNATTTINNNAIEEVVVLSGGFNAEYGRIMSGVVNVITREGSSRYTGSLEAVTDQVGGKFGNEFLGSNVYGYSVYDGNFGGPLLAGHDWGNFFYSGQYRYQGDRSPNAFFDRPLPSNGLKGWTHQGKLTFPLAQAMKVRVGGLWSDDDWQEYLNTYRFNLEHAPRYTDRNRSLTGEFSHTLSAKAFYSVGASYFLTERKRGDGVYFDQIERYANHPQADVRNDILWFWPGFGGAGTGPLGDSLAASAARAGGGHVFDDYLRRRSEYWALKGDYTNQVNRYHQLKGGAEYDQHTLRFYNAYFPVNYPGRQQDINRYGFAVNGRDDENGGVDGPRKPVTASMYAQDKYERSGLVVNAGLRWDYINVDTPALFSESLPLGFNASLDADSELVANRTYNRISPRIGIGFPVTDRTVLHVNWGQFFQQPNLQDLYVSYRFLEYKIQKGGYYVGFGNPNLKPEQTTAYEVGIAHQLSDVSRFDVSAYYKDVKDLVQVEAIGSKPNGFASYRNKDFATIKGLDLGFVLRRINHIQANLAYSLSYALGTGSVSNTGGVRAWQGAEQPRQTAPLDFDQRHKIALNLDYLLEKDEGPVLFGMRPLENLSVNMIYNVASGTPYTPTDVSDEVSLAAVGTKPSGPLNSRYGPWTQSFDVKAARGFAVGGLDMSAYLWVVNMFGTENAINVYTGTGSPFTTGFLDDPAGRPTADKLRAAGIDPEAAYALALQNEGLFSVPRMIRVGLRMGF